MVSLGHLQDRLRDDANIVLQALILYGTMMASTVCRNKPCRSIQILNAAILFKGLIKFGFVTHAFIDGYSRYVVGLRVNNNNRAQTVLDLFSDAREQNRSTPSRVRGDHGTENLYVAQWMEEHGGPDRGSYIWGRCVTYMFSVASDLIPAQERAQQSRRASLV